MTKNILIILVAIAALGWLLQYIASGGGGPSSDEVKTVLVAELEQFDHFAVHRSLLIEVVDRVHSGNYDRARHDRERYRSEMYRALIKALSDAGEEKVAIRLEQFRARQ